MRYNVLSIDWDYFIDCSIAERHSLFPDGGNENISLDLSNIIWYTRYSETIAKKNYGLVARNIQDISVLEDDFDFIKNNITQNMSYFTVIQFADSHSAIYNFLKQYISDDDSLDIYNIDHHCDYYNIGNSLNCGNWINKLDADNNIDSLTWIANKDSDLKVDNSSLNCTVSICTDLKKSLPADIEWDFIFICRSSVWSPPHLDKRFNEFYTLLSNIGVLNDDDSKFFIDRYSFMKDTITKEANELISFYDSMYRKK